jgi:hypothetical protein
MDKCWQAHWHDIHVKNMALGINMDWATIPKSLQAQRQPKLVGRILWFAPTSFGKKPLRSATMLDLLSACVN